MNPAMAVMYDEIRADEMRDDLERATDRARRGLQRCEDCAHFRRLYLEPSSVKFLRSINPLARIRDDLGACLLEIAAGVTTNDTAFSMDCDQWEEAGS